MKNTVPNFISQIKKELNLTAQDLVEMNHRGLKRELKNYILVNFPKTARDEKFIPAEKIENMTVLDIYYILDCLKLTSDLGDSESAFVNVRYDTIGIYNSPYKDPWNVYEGLLRECRSTIINLESNTIVSLPFYKFFNIDENEEYSKKNIQKRIAKSKSLLVMDKLDGSFIQITFDGNTFIVGTSSSFSSKVETKSNNEHLDIAIDYFFYDMAYKSLREQVKQNPQLTFMFELIDNRVPNVVSYTKDNNGLYLLGMRDKNTGKMISIEEKCFPADIKTVQIFNLKLEEILDICRKGNGQEREGFVLNIDGFLVKIKLNEFFLLNRINGGFNFRTLLACFKNGTLDDMISKMPLTKRRDTENLVHKLAEYQCQMTEIIEKIVFEEKKNKDHSIKEVVEIFQTHYPKSWFGFLIQLYKKGNETKVDYLNFKKEEDFEQAFSILKEWK